MFTVNLEKKLLKENSKYLSKQEDLFVDFVNNSIAENTKQDRETLREAGFDELFTAANKAETKNKIYNALLKKYGNKLFTEKQIKSLCLKYNLRFLPTKYYKGDLPYDLANKIKEHEQEFSSNLLTSDGSKYIESDGYYICAPKSSFKLAERPKDPLFFHKVDKKHDLYVLVHKWGNDLSAFNRIIGFFRNFEDIGAILLGILLFTGIGHIMFTTDPDVIKMIFVTIMFLSGILCFIYAFENYNKYEKNWNSEFKN